MGEKRQDSGIGGQERPQFVGMAARQKPSSQGRMNKELVAAR
jgi:hypothetical protein